MSEQAKQNVVFFWRDTGKNGCFSNFYAKKCNDLRLHAPFLSQSRASRSKTI